METPVETIFQSNEYVCPYGKKTAMAALYIVIRDGNELRAVGQLKDYPWINVTSRLKLTGEDPHKESLAMVDWLRSDLVDLIEELETELARLSKVDDC